MSRRVTRRASRRRVVRLGHIGEYADTTDDLVDAGEDENGRGMRDHARRAFLRRQGQIMAKQMPEASMFELCEGEREGSLYARPTASRRCERVSRQAALAALRRPY